MIYKTIKQDKYQCINNEVFTYPISPGARCLLAYMLTKPADWTFFNSAIEKEFGVNSSKLRRYLKELKDYGLVRKYSTQKTGRIEWITEVYESLDLVPNVQNSIGSKSTDTNSIDTKHTDILSTDTNKVLNTLNTDNTNIRELKIPKKTPPEKKEIKPNYLTKNENPILSVAYDFCKNQNVNIKNHTNFKNSIYQLLLLIGEEKATSYINYLGSERYQNDFDEFKPQINDGYDLYGKYTAIKNYVAQKVNKKPKGLNLDELTRQSNK